MGRRERGDRALPCSALQPTALRCCTPRTTLRNDLPRFATAVYPHSPTGLGGERWRGVDEREEREWVGWV
jgi:hypothetical protein